MTALALVLRLVGLNGGLWWDEMRTLVDSVRSPLFKIITEFPGDNQHTLFSVLSHLSIAVFGEHPWSLRLPAALLGVATIPVLYFFAREFVGKVEALLASLLLAVSYHHVWFSQNARGYTAIAFLTVLSSFLLLRGLRLGKKRDFVWYALAAALGAYAHLTMLFLIVSHAIVCVVPLGLPRPDSESWAKWRQPLFGFVLAGAITVILYAPALLEVQQFFVERQDPVGSATPRWAVLELIRGLEIGVATGTGALIGATLLLVGTVSYLRKSLLIAALFIVPGIVTIAGTMAMHRPIRPRFLFFLAGFGILILVRGALEVGARISRSVPQDGRVSPLGGALVGLMVVLSAASLLPLYRLPKQDFQGALAMVEARQGVDESIVTAGGARYPYREYFGRPWREVTSLAELQEARSGVGRVWVVYALPGYIDSQLLDTIRRECADERVFRGTLADGDVTVCAVPPIDPARRP